MSRKIIAAIGPYTYTYRDGRVTAEYHTQEIGATTGAQYVTDGIEIDDSEGLTHWATNAPLPTDGGIWRQACKGWVILGIACDGTPLYHSLDSWNP